MIFTDNMIAPLFKIDSSKRRLFCPWGWNKAYILESEERYNEIRSGLSKYMSFTLILSVVTPNVYTYFQSEISLITLMGLVITLLLVIYYFLVNKYTFGLQKSTETVKYSEYLKEISRSHSWFKLLFLQTGSILFVIAGYYMLNEQPALGCLAMAFFGLGALVFPVMMYIKFKRGV